MCFRDEVTFMIKPLLQLLTLNIKNNTRPLILFKIYNVYLLYLTGHKLLSIQNVNQV